MSDGMLIILGITCWFGPAAVVLFLGFSYEWPALLTLLLAGISVYLGSQLTKLLQKPINKHISDSTYSLDSYTLKVIKRSQWVANNIHIRRANSISANYNPAEITYTSATVGATTVGRFDIKDESYNLIGNKTDYYYLQEGMDDYYRPIYTIILTDELAAEAKAHPVVSKYLVGNMLDLSSHPTVSKTQSTTASNLLREGNLKSTTSAINVLMDGATTSTLTKEECHSIKTWLSGK